MKLYVIRHGQSEANAGKYFSGWSQVPLTEKGIKDAKAAGELIRNITFDKVYSSDLMRAIQTQQYALPGVEGERTPLIREYNVGNLEDRSIAECTEEMGEAFIQNRARLDFTPYGGENNDMVDARVAEFMQMLERSGYQNVVAFCHAGTMRCILDYVLKVRTPRNASDTANGAVSVYEYLDGVWRVRMLNYQKELVGSDDESEA